MEIIVHHIFFYSNENLTAAHIISELSGQRTSCSRFNINHGNVLDRAIHGFKCASYDLSHEILVKFTDDEERNEDGVDTGGPKCEFLTANELPENENYL